MGMFIVLNTKKILIINKDKITRSINIEETINNFIESR